jgi:hypothetical protein
MTLVTRARQHRYRLKTPGRPVERAPRPEIVLGTIESLPRDGHVLLESMDEQEVYIQAWLRPDGTYQLEFREGSAATHLQTRSASRERVAAAFTGWLEGHSGDGDSRWREGLQWKNISGELSGGARA